MFMKTDPTFSFVIPFMNEEAVLPELLKRLEVLTSEIATSCEIVFVDDGSRDRSAEIVANAASHDLRIKLVRLSRNFGHQIAVTAGLDVASGQAIIIMDADLQDPPEVVHDLIAKWREGYEIVHAQRRVRQGETLFKKMTASVFYRVLSKLSAVEVPRNVGDFRLIDQKVLRAIKSMPERDRFLRGMFAWVGFRQTLVQFDRLERHAGGTKYPFKKMLRLATDGVIGFSDAPLRLALWLGAIISFCAMGYGAYIVVLTMFSDQLVSGWASTVVILSFLSGINLLISGLIGLYVGRIHTESKQRPLYLVSETVGLAEEVTQMHQPQQVLHGQG